MNELAPRALLLKNMFRQFFCHLQRHYFLKFVKYLLHYLALPFLLQTSDGRTATSLFFRVIFALPIFYRPMEINHGAVKAFPHPEQYINYTRPKSGASTGSYHRPLL